MSTEEPSACPICGAEIPEESPDRLCPNCLLAGGLAAGIAPQDDEEATLPMEEPPSPEGFEVPEQVGPYRVLSLLGEGGMGQVFAAEQEKPLKRRVALKIIKPGMDSREILSRFEAERQALALMEHPHIARVLDAGTTEEGRPYFAMELVAGIPITAYCDQRRLTLTERLALFLKVCHAVQHAHQKGIIHRDLKPSNILVTTAEDTDEPNPKVIDFGVAKALGPGLTEHTFQTAAGQLLGTPQYMSPEQASFDATGLDTRSDLYALGIILYELLTGLTPLDAKTIRKAGLEAMLRSVREQEPPRPTTRLGSLAEETRSSIAEARQLPAHKLTQLLRGDLEWVLMKALEREPERRYQSARDFAQDIGRFLNHEAVSAVAPSLGYRARKFARRNKAALTVGTVIVLLLVGGLAASVSQAIRANRNAAEERVAREEAEDVSRLFLGIFRSPAPGLDGKEIKVVTLLERAAEGLDRKLEGQPRRKAQMRKILGETYLRLGLPNEAVPLLEEAFEVLGDEPEDLDRKISGVAMLLTTAYTQAVSFEKAIAHAEALYHSRREKFGEEDVLTLGARAELATCHERSGNWQKALPIQTEVLAACREHLGPAHDHTRKVLLNIANLQWRAGKLKEAQRLMEEVMSLTRERYEPDHPETLFVELNTATLMLQAGKTEEALPMLESVRKRSERVFGPDRPQTLRAMNNLAEAYRRLERTKESLAMAEEILALRQPIYPEDSLMILDSRLNVAVHYEADGQKEEAFTRRQALVEDYIRVFTVDNEDTLLAMEHLAISLCNAFFPPRLQEARDLEETIFTKRKEVLPAGHPAIFEAAENLHTSCELLGDNERARELEKEFPSLR